MTGLLTLYQTLTRSGEPCLRALLRWRLKESKEDPARLGERMGDASRPRPAGNLVWIHAASVGEAQAALVLIDALRRERRTLNILVTSGTVTSAELMTARLPPEAIHQYVPVDHPTWVSKFLDHWRPTLALWMESELWPNLVLETNRRGIPQLLINARLSDRSFSRWRIARGMIGRLLKSFDLVLAQSAVDRERFELLGAARVIVTDNIKFSAAPLPVDPIALSGLRLTIGERPVWVYASTHEGEEDLACRVHQELRERLPGLLTIIVPRHPERREQIAGTCFEHGLKFRLRSDNVALPAPDDDIYIADTLGELGLFYRLCNVAMIGRSFSNDGGGGHNPIEAAQLGCAVITGPNNQFQRPLYDDMQSDGAVVEVTSQDELTAVLEELLTEPHTLESLKRRSEKFVARKTMVIDQTLLHLGPYLSRLDDHAA